MVLTEEEKERRRKESEQLQRDVDATKKLAESKFLAASIKYLNEHERVSGLHVSQISKNCGRRGAWEYQDGLLGEDEGNMNLDERGIVVLLVGQKIHEPVMTDVHELELEYTHAGITLHGTLDEAIFTRKRISIIDKKTTRYIPENAYTHHKTQVETYGVIVANAKILVRCKKCGKAKLSNDSATQLPRLKQDDHEHELTVEDVDFADREFFGAVTYINVGDTKSVWEQRVKAFPFKISVADGKHRLDARLDEMAQFMQDHIPLESVYGWECLPAGTPILGDNKPIETYSRGDYCIGIDGNETQIRKTFERQYIGTMITLRGMSLLPITLTPEHPLLVADGKIRFNNDQRIEELGKWNWVRAGDVSNGKFLMVPRLKGNVNITKLELRKFINPNRGGVIKTKVKELELDDETAWIMGLYVAEGSFEKTGPVFSLGKHEVARAEKIRQWSEKTGYSVVIDEVATALRIRICSAVLGRAFDHWFGHGAANKKIPDWIIRHTNQGLIRSFLRGYIEGDGYVSHTAKSHRNILISCTTVSNILAQQIQLVYARFGILASIIKRKGGTGYIQNRKVTIHDHYQISIVESPLRRRYIVKDGFIATPITKSTKSQFTGLVYNLSTDAETYLVSNGVVHNCNTCPYFAGCRMLDAGEAGWKSYMPKA